MIALIAAAFATYRLAVLIAEEEGPWSLAQRLRNLHTADDWIGRGIRCPACVGFWVAWLTTAVALYLNGGRVPGGWAWDWPFWSLAVAGAARWLWKMERP